MVHKVHLHHNGGAACGAVAVNAGWPHTVGRVVWPSVVSDYKCKMCNRLYLRDKLGITAANDRPEPHPTRVCTDREVST